VWRPGGPCPAYLAHRLSIRLAPEAARQGRRRGAPSPARSLGIAQVDAALAAIGALRVEPEFRGERPPADPAATDYTAFYLVTLGPGARLETALERLRAVPGIASASPIGVAPVSSAPDDSLWGISWWFHQPSRRDIHALEAWERTRGDSSLVVALLDTGLVPYHPDLGGTVAGRRAQVWTNAAEAEGAPGVDDDGNGFVDDVWGWDFVNLERDEATPGEDWRDEDGDPNDFVGHGTSVAGLIGALSDNRIGITGTAWQVRIMPLRVGWSAPERQTGVVSMSYLAQAVRYATRMGAHVINLSVSTVALLELDAAVDDAIAAGITVVVAAGNNGSPAALYPRPGLIYVTATDRNDQVPVWANRGYYVDLAAPGAEIATTVLKHEGSDSLGLRQPHYSSGVNSTSFSAPIVSGSVVLLQGSPRARGLEPLSPSLVRRVLVGAVDDISAQNPELNEYGAGRLNVGRAVRSPPVLERGLGARSAGPMVTFRTRSGASRLALATDKGSLLLLDPLGTRLDSLGSTPLGGAAQGGLAAAELGAGRGLGIFVAPGPLTDGRLRRRRRAPARLAGEGIGPLPPTGARRLDGDGALDVACASLVAFDNEGLVSPVSNTAMSFTDRPGETGRLSLTVVENPVATPVRLRWRRPEGVPAPAVIHFYDLAGRLRRSLPLGDSQDGAASWDGRDREGNPVGPGLYFATLTAGDLRVRARVTIVRR
jgi:subtilisin family serine protease